MTLRGGNGLKKLKRDVIKIIIIFSILFLPFLHITDLISMEIFVDSFENPEHYLCIESENLLYSSKTDQCDLIIILKSSHPEFKINKGDNIIYFSDEGTIESCKIIDIKTFAEKEKYYKQKKENFNNYPIFEEQIIGKILKSLDNNIFNSLSVTIWEASINNLNIRAITD